MVCHLVNTTSATSNESGAAEFLQAIQLGGMHELLIADRLFELVAKAAAEKSRVLLILITARGVFGNVEAILDSRSIKLVMQVQPNGFEFEIPIKVKQITQIKLDRNQQAQQLFAH